MIFQRYRNPPVLCLHDVCPRTWEDCRRWLDALAPLGLRPASLFVIPNDGGAEGASGLPDDFASWLRDLHAAGHPLWMHGYTHRDRNGGEAEFATLSAPGIRRRVAMGRAVWFRAGLPPPEGFCPPCWKMSSGGVDVVQEEGFQWVDLRTRVVRVRRVLRSPALSSWGGRSLFARLWNCLLPVQDLAFEAVPYPQRIVMHPADWYNGASGPLLWCLRRHGRPQAPGSPGGDGDGLPSRSARARSIA